MIVKVTGYRGRIATDPFKLDGVPQKLLEVPRLRTMVCKFALAWPKNRTNLSVVSGLLWRFTQLMPGAFRARDLLLRETPVPILPEINSVCPPEFTAAVWREFFLSRNRGISCAAHLGWLDNTEVTFVGLRQSGVLVAGLVLRGIAGREGVGHAGMIGLVWVEPTLRGQGLSRTLLAEAIDWSQKQGLMDLLLWTSKPDVYAKAGFRLCDNALFGSIRMYRRSQRGSQVIGSMSWPGTFDCRPLPAFACAGTFLYGEEASAVVLSTAAEPILAEWTGDNLAVINMLDAWMPDRWSLNALYGDALPELLRERGDDVALAPTRLRMILSLDGATEDLPYYPLRLLDRI